MLDGVYANETGQPRFHSLPTPTVATMQHLLDVIVLPVLRCLERDGTTHLVFEPIEAKTPQHTDRADDLDGALRRLFAIDLFICPDCGGRLRLQAMTLSLPPHCGQVSMSMAKS